MKAIHKKLDQSEQEVEDILMTIRSYVEDTEDYIRKELEEIIGECENDPEDVDISQIKWVAKALISWMEDR